MKQVTIHEAKANPSCGIQVIAHVCTKTEGQPRRIVLYSLVSTPHPIVIAALIVFVSIAGAQVTDWTETRKETIWRTRYTNCDKGYAVDLPKGVVAHAGLHPGNDQPGATLLRPE